jgi:hypothetical protein
MAHLVGKNLQTIDGPLAQQVKVHTISRIKKRIPGGPDLDRAQSITMTVANQ